jgi:hypothetical protein
LILALARFDRQNSDHRILDGLGQADLPKFSSFGDKGFAMGWLPGTDVSLTQFELIARLEERRTRLGYTPLEAMHLSQRVGKDFLRSPFFAAKRFLVYYERHDCPRLNRLHIVPSEELVAWLDSRIRPERGEGIDLTITGFEMAEFLITNHDGEMWVRRPSEWPLLKQRQLEPEAVEDSAET